MSFASTCVLRSRRAAAGASDPRTPGCVVPGSDARTPASVVPGSDLRTPGSGEEQPPILTAAPDAARQVAPALPVPSRDQLVQAGDMALGQRARRAPGRERGAAQQP